MKIKSGASGDLKSATNKTDVVKPNFTFTWNSTKGTSAQGKVFKKKNVKNNQNHTDAAKPRQNVYISDVNKDIPIEQNVEFNNNKHIKRKQRKDKLRAKELMKEGVDVNLSKSTASDKQKKHFPLFTETDRKLYVNTATGKSLSETLFTSSGKNFSDLGIHRHLISNLEKIDFKSLTNVQEKAIPVLMTGQNCLIRSQTGSGKTLAYAVPIIDALQSITPRLKRTDGVQAMVVVPTRELTLQTHELFSKINTFQWIVTSHLCGGENRKSEKDRIRKGITVLIGTPGRLLDHALHTTSLDLSKIRCLVLDEADRLLDMGFRKDIISLVEQIDKAKSNCEYDPMVILKNSQATKSPENVDSSEENEGKQEHHKPILRDVNSKERQTILLSATLNKGVSELAEFTMKDHVYIDALDHENISADLASEETEDFVIPNTVKQEFLMTFVKHRLFTLSALILAKSKQNSKLFVFMASSNMVEFHYDLFTKCLQRMPKNRCKIKTNDYKGDRVVDFDEDFEEDSDEEEEIVMDTEFFKLHGSMDQKVRKEVFNGFRKAKKGVLLCTDVAARGIDVPEADCIIQYTPPQSDKDYLHRVGRTGRAGKYGSAIIFLTHEEQDYISHLKQHKVFLKRKDPAEYLKHLCEVMDQPNVEEAATALQRHYENQVAKDKELHRSACFAYSTWSRFYNSYSAKLRPIFDFKKVNLGHYVTSFALTITPTEVAKVVRGQVANIEKPKLNKKLANHEQGDTTSAQQPKSNQQKRKSLSLTTSEYSSGLEQTKKKKKKKHL